MRRRAGWLQTDMDREPGSLDLTTAGKGGRATRWRVLALGVLVVAVPITLSLGLDSDLGLAAFREHRFALLGFAATEPVLASLAYMVLYGAAVAVSLPGVALLTMAGGFIFGWVQGALYGLLAATITATAVFVFARGTLADAVRNRSGSPIRRFAERFRSHAFRYTFLLNLVPIFPFGMVITVPAACGVRIPTFVVGAFLGLLPSTLMLSHLGEDVGHILLGNRPIEFGMFLTPEIFTAVSGLLALSLLPFALRKLDPRRIG